jgi:hypothetical protein
MVRRHRINMAARLKASMELLRRSKVMAPLDSINNSHLRASMVSNHPQGNTDNSHLQDNMANSHHKGIINLRLDHHQDNMASNHPQGSLARPHHRASLGLHLLRVSMGLHLLKASSVRRAVLEGHQLNLLSAMVRSR